MRAYHADKNQSEDNFCAVFCTWRLYHGYQLRMI